MNYRHGTNNRKNNLVHLLSNKPERNSRNGRHRTISHGDGASGSGAGSNNVGYHHRAPATTIHKFSKQQFLQANCQFVVLHGHDYTVHKVDPDWPVEWACVEEVRFKQSACSETICPICLEPPTAAKITRCGHIYCWTCILHYLSLIDENCRQCPICFEPVYRSDLRSVVSHSFINHNVGEEISFRLMFRKKGCVEVEPYGSGSDLTSDTIISDTIGINDYSSHANLVIVDSQTILENVATRELRELQCKLDSDVDSPDICFTEQAIAKVQRRIARLQQAAANSPRHMNDKNPLQTNLFDPNTKSYLFYQCSDGQHIYLSPFSTRILCYEFGRLEKCPLELKAEVLQMDWISMNESRRRRFRYLEHLPLSCEFRLIEIDFEKSNLISSRSFKVFEDQILARKQERERRLKEERKREKIIQVEQNRKIYGIQPSVRINLDSMDQFPSVSDERYSGLTQLRTRTTTDESFTTDDEEVDIEVRQPARAEEPSGSNDNVEEPVNEKPVETITLSFKDIQIQEAAKASQASNSKPQIGPAKGPWGRQSRNSASKVASGQASGQSSFAQLLVGAKTSQKQWTRNPTKPVNQSVVSQMSKTTNDHSEANHVSDNSGDELRAPPCEFNISDYIDMSLASSKKKKKNLRS